MNAADSSVNLYSFAFVFFLMLLGASVHWAKLRKKKRTSAGLLEYIFTDNPKSSAKAGGSIFVAAAAAAGTGVADWIDPVLLWTIVTTTHTMPSICFFGIGAALSFGYMSDSGFNDTSAAPTMKPEEKPEEKKEEASDGKA